MQVVAVARAGAASVLLLALSSPAMARNSCHLSAADKAANAELSYDEFDQRGRTPTSFRQLSDRHCDLEAAEAVEDYLVRRPQLTALQQRNLIFHMAQGLAMAGHEREAAKVILGALEADPKPGGLDWNDYVRGTWAFLVKDGAQLEAQQRRLEQRDSRGDRINAGVLAGLRNCFGQSYRAAYQAACRPAAAKKGE